MRHAIDLILGEQWAMTPEALELMIAIAQGQGEGPQAVAARIGKPLINARKATTRGDTAIIPITGPIFRRANLMTEISGATSIEILATDIQSALDNPSVKRLVLDIDSPGGQASGISEIASMIRAAQKPIVAYVDGVAASAAYWLASAASEIVMSPTAMAGSIGVAASFRQADDKDIRIISSQSPLKQAGPETEDGRAEVQRVVDELAAVFIGDVAAYRGTTPDRVAAEFGRGGVLVGASAVAVGMADRVGTFESLFFAGSSGSYEGISMSENTSPGVTRDYLAAEHPALLQSIQAEGVAIERDRVSAILALVVDAHHARGVADAAINAGLTAEQATAMVAAVPEPAAVASFESLARANFVADLPAPAQTIDAGEAADSADPEAAARAKWDADADLRAEFGGKFDRWQAFQKAKSAGRVRILRKVEG